jgi:hypothetical protein
MRTPQTIQCNACGARLPMDEAEGHDAGLVKCSYCATTTDVHHLPGSRRRLKVPLPPGLTCEMEGHDLVITKRWFNLNGLVSVAVAVMVSSVFFSNSERWMVRADSPGVVPLVMLFGVLATAYVALCFLLNRTVIRLSPDCFRITHQPLPAPGGGAWTPMEVAQLYCTERMRHHKNGVTVDYEVRSVFEDGSSRVLVNGLPEKTMAIFIEQQLEAAMEIRDVPIGGEVLR